MKGSLCVFGHLGSNIEIASTSNNAPGRASCGTPIVVLAGGAALSTLPVAHKLTRLVLFHGAPSKPMPSSAVN
jgi:hypothetical protein